MGYGLLRLLDESLCAIVSLFFFVSLNSNETTVWLFPKRQCFVFLTLASFVRRSLASHTCPPSTACTSVSSKSQQVFQCCRILRACIIIKVSKQSVSSSFGGVRTLPIPLPIRTRFMNESCVLIPQLRRIMFPYPLIVVAPRTHICKQHFSPHSRFFNAKTLVLSKPLYLVLFSLRRSMGIVLKPSSRLAWTHCRVLTTSEDGRVENKMWRIVQVAMPGQV